MNINTNSWHYRLLAKTDLRIPRNLCPYVRQVLLAIFLCLFIAALIIGLVVSLFMILIYFPFVDRTLGAAIAGAGSWLIVGFVALRVARSLRNEVDTPQWWLTDIYTRPKRNKRDSLFTQYLKALHDRVCPNIEFEREEA